MNNDSKQEKGKRKSLPQEACIKTINGERHGAVAGNASAKNLNQSGSERLNRFALTHSDSAAKLKQKTETTKKKVQNLINNGYFIKIQAFYSSCQWRQNEQRFDGYGYQCTSL